MNPILPIIKGLTKQANLQAQIANDLDQPAAVRDQASVHYGTLLLVITAVNEALTDVIADELERIETLLRDAAPPGANPKLVHPSLQPPLRLVKEDIHEPPVSE